MAHEDLRWACYRCGTRFHERVAWCPTCNCENLVGPSANRPRAAVEGVPQVTTARELAAAQWSLITSNRYDAIRIMRGALVLVYGPPASGKSTFVLGFIDGLDLRSLVYLSEEGLSPAVGERLVRLGIRDDRMCLVAKSSLDHLVAQVQEHRAHVLVVDSVSATTLDPADLRHLLAVAKLRALLAVQQVNKAGEPAGSNAFGHEADVVIHVDESQWRVEKSRYQPAGSGGEVFHGRTS